MLKCMMRRVLRSGGLDLVRYSPDEARQACRQLERSYRELVLERAMMPRGQVSLGESRFLAELVRSLVHPGPIVEIGTLFGRSTQVLLLEKEPDRQMISVDNYSWNPLHLQPDVHFSITSQLLQEAREKYNLIQMRIDKNAFFASYDGPSPSLVFCDAIHTFEETKLDIEWASSVDAGVICGHDYDLESCPGVVKAVDTFGGPKRLVETLWVI